MSKTVSPKQRVLTLSLATSLVAILAALCLPLPARANSLASPVVSAHPGYWADTACSEAGEPIPGSDWKPGGSPPYPLEVGLLDTCQYTGGALTLRDEGAKDSTPGTGPAWIYEASGDSAMVGGFVDVTMISPGGEANLSINNGRGEWSPIARCDESCTTPHGATATIPSTEDWILTAQALCKAPTGKTACATTGVNAELSISRSTILLHNTATPAAGAVTGSLTESPVSGTASVAFQATDSRGPGVYRVAVDVDGKELVSETPETNLGQCVAHGTYEKALNFHSPQPCPEELPVHVEVPTEQVSDGTHLVEVIEEDAAGHKVVAFDKRIDFENGNGTASSEVGFPAGGTPPLSPITSPTPTPAPSRGAANGTPASETASLLASWHGAAGTTLASPYGRPRRIVGRLSSPGAPIAGAMIEVVQRPSAAGAVASSLTTTRTASNGAFTVTVPATESSASIQLVYRSHFGDAQPAASATLRLRVPASVHLRVSPHVVSVGETITLSGTLAGPLPAAGKQVVFEARAGSREPWHEFESGKAAGRGTFKATHRFKLPGPERYQFRVVSEEEPAFAFARGVSNVVTIRER